MCQLINTFQKEYLAVYQSENRWYCSSNHISQTMELMKYGWERGNRGEDSRCLNQHQAHLGSSSSYQILLGSSLMMPSNDQKKKGIRVQKSEKQRNAQVHREIQWHGGCYRLALKGDLQLQKSSEFSLNTVRSSRYVFLCRKQSKVGMFCRKIAGKSVESSWGVEGMIIEKLIDEEL